ncbi:restriction endonuclease type II-like protein [Gaertneriomyces semiglobifer]|nr:restriction endonuclease type II-like protein [Gaertneriomyces semiglobifer]
MSGEHGHGDQKRPLFKVPTPAEVEQRQREIRERATHSGFRPTSVLPSAGSGPAPPIAGQSNQSYPGTVLGKHARRDGPAISHGLPAESRHSVYPRQAVAGAGQPGTGGTGTGGSPAQPARPGGGHPHIIVNKKQGNPVLNFIKNVRWSWGDILPDYQVGQTSCVVYLSLKYHRLHPDHVYNRIKPLTHQYLLRVLLCLVDVDDYHSCVRGLTRACVYNNFTIILAWSQEEAARYLETFKAYEHKPPDLIKERVDNDYSSKLTDALTNIKSVNKTDVWTLASAFGSLQKIMSATAEELSDCPGFGEQKIRRLQEAFTQPFILNKRQRQG